MPFFSVIVPVYNVERYLPECLASLQSQTFLDWECLCINDGSLDDSGELLDACVRQDGRFRIVHQRNRGVAWARQRGLDVASGRWIAWLDPDDWVDDDFLEAFAESSRNSQAAIVWTDFWEHCGGHQAYREQRPPEDAEGCVRALLSECLYGALWNKAFQRDFLVTGGFSFEGCMLQTREDLCFLLRLLRGGTRVAYASGARYHYLIREGSLLRSEAKTDDSMRMMARRLEAQQAIEKAVVGLDVGPELRSLRQKIKLLLCFTPSIPTKVFLQVYPEERDVWGVHVGLFRKWAFWFAVRGGRPLVASVWHIAHGLKTWGGRLRATA